MYRLGDQKIGARQVVTSIIFLANEAAMFYDGKYMSVTNYFINPLLSTLQTVQILDSSNSLPVNINF